MSDRNIPSNQRVADVPREVLLGKTLRQRAHQLRIEACSAWSDVVRQPIPGLDEAKCDYARALDERLRAIIDELADLTSPVETAAEPKVGDDVVLTDEVRLHVPRDGWLVHRVSSQYILRHPDGEQIQAERHHFAVKTGAES